jgi:hypothetical protein
VPLPSLVFIAFAVGVASALAGAVELRLSPRHALLTNSFRAFALFLCLVLVPISVYFYVFHGDWFLLYSIDVRRIPSAVALLGFVVEFGIGVLGFVLGSALARSQRSTVGIVAVGLSAILATSVLVLWPDRLSVVGTFAQYRGDFGLERYGGALMQGGLVMGLVLFMGTAYLLVRIWMSRKRA